MADVSVDLESKNSKDLLNQGMRAFVLQDFPTAVQALGKASEILVAEHGDELHDSLGEVYLYYGKALVGLSRQEAEPLGDAIPKGENEESEDEEDGEEAENEANEENEKQDVPEKNGDENGKADEKQDAPEKNTAENDAESSTNGKTEELEESTATQEGDDAADPTDLQVAWEVLELAKKIFERNGAEGKKQLAETLTTLGEISLETEHFEQAIVDIKDGLAIQIELFPKDSRKVAETYYNLGVAYSTNTQFDEGIEAFNKSLEYLNNRIKVLEEAKDGNSDDEIKEIKELIPEILEKIADMKSCKEEVCRESCICAENLIETMKKAKISEATKLKEDLNN